VGRQKNSGLIMHAILRAGEQGGLVEVESRIERPAAFTDVDGAALENA
jgi:hypothetical protein